MGLIKKLERSTELFSSYLRIKLACQVSRLDELGLGCGLMDLRLDTLLLFVLNNLILYDLNQTPPSGPDFFFNLRQTIVRLQT